MILPNLAILKTFHDPGKCESCGRYCKQREPHHCFTKGAGQLDIPINLIALGHSKTFQCPCHAKGQGGKANRDRFLAIVAKREKTTPADIEEVVWLIRRLPKEPTRAAIERELSTLGEGARLLAVRTLKEAMKII